MSGTPHVDGLLLLLQIFVVGHNSSFNLSTRITLGAANPASTRIFFP